MTLQPCDLTRRESIFLVLVALPCVGAGFACMVSALALLMLWYGTGGAR